MQTSLQKTVKMKRVDGVQKTETKKWSKDDTLCRSAFAEGNRIHWSFGTLLVTDQRRKK